MDKVTQPRKHTESYFWMAQVSFLRDVPEGAPCGSPRMILLSANGHTEGAALRHESSSPAGGLASPWGLPLRGPLPEKPSGERDQWQNW